ncbi:RNB domain-containing ribonuclease [Corynebacterium phoceense]|uniref:RNB domain-containing ribonuclease n=1 Tax=Corynebacterium phoceense TaxID=1686286 RepID=UPI00211C0E1B|nr:RNB domain-containing ribonuclease [Corynebacterium phoceense]MCQ9330507.1 RNB domain-containing ribonuclease [Corynebacterium phoceense]MCQ9346903.1 RNB domain-containing ribonuclease [Corynebacterium phoceense]
MKLYAAPLDFHPVAEEFRIKRAFPSAVEEAARNAHDRFADTRRDARDIPLVTIDPAGSMDLDQAVHIEATATGYTVHYAIADVMAFIAPGSPLEVEGFKRGQTIYLPDEPARLHPAALSEDAASLLPDAPRPAVLWTFQLDSAGEVSSFDVERALVQSRARLDYEGVHADLVAGRLHSSIALLPEVGALRQASSLRRSAINLRVPSQSVEETTTESGETVFELVAEPRYEVMDFNSEISLLTGMCAGQLMAFHGVGLLRTLPAASPESEASFRSEVAALGFDLTDQSISEFLLSVDPDTPRGMAAMREAQYLLRGAGYQWLTPDEEPEVHAGIGGYYAHVTAPLRRLADRFATEVCLALSAGEPAPEWVSSRADDLLETMKRTTSVASQVDRACLKLTEATVLAPWVGTNFDSIILDSTPEKSKARAFVPTPPIVADVIGAPEPGAETAISLVRANPAERSVAFAWPAD